MISVFLCDDDPVWLHRLHEAVAGYQIKSDWEIQIEYQTTSPEKFWRYLTEHTPAGGIYFLDIDFKSSINGMFLARQIRETDPFATIIFITTHDEMVMETFRLKLEVLDYIVKDKQLPEAQIHQCLQHIEENYLKGRGSHSSITLRTAGSYHTILLQEIYYIESIKGTHKICMHLKCGVYLFSESLTSVQRRLGNDFFQCHKTCLVNIRHIRELDSKDRQILLDNGDYCPCSVREWKNLVQKYLELHK